MGETAPAQLKMRHAATDMFLGRRRTRMRKKRGSGSWAGSAEQGFGRTHLGSFGPSLRRVGPQSREVSGLVEPPYLTIETRAKTRVELRSIKSTIA
jgi:hypothetical protein